MKNRTTLIVTCTTVFLAQLGMSIYLPALPDIARDLGADASRVSWGLSVYLIGMALPMLLWGSLSQRLGRKPVLLAALGLYGLGNLALPLGTTVEAFLTLRLIQGIGASGISVMARVLIRDSFSGDLLAKALSWISIAFVIALGIGQYLGSLIQAVFGWEAIFQGLGAVSLAMAAAVSRARFPVLVQTGNGQSAWGIYGHILRQPAFMLPALAGGLGYGVIVAFNTAAPLILQESFHWSPIEYGLLGWPVSAAYLLGALVVNAFVLRTGQRRMMGWGIALVLGGSMSMLAGSLTLSSIALLFWLPYCFAVFGQSLIYPISLSLANEGSPVAGAYAMALSGFLHQLMASVIGAMASLLLSQQAWPLAALCALLGAAAMLCVKFVPPRVA
ncbi:MULTISPECIES: MFS transporter [unclassified Pseudomonas]|uniref:MFS transporter n=1 Tax=unclassified Pseudomonas TaxID=196821 RepID=UPI000876A82C|nr:MULTISPECIES: MFS transporter [unclassified Pseudomonas]SCZ41672.1 drug resistance transporter, Bcr/CflA subfamily [Pseudomonas sp. NFACC44-2]SDA87977.1 drug resistance transporter, Bcr/CflA subfamily [Pseudomonas sp. NFACC51]SDY28863.1 drug resistance transporter, Bcr/CflA subfamily [Pseudomonas sp. NFACC08-1]SEJ86151.1 drug resistance transporter, Bcr/CflA subfamily [Pseudomonas sp. NFACC07-1]SFH82972.1 drug resistance transporter, Bcr/CflA subfamily [Pseudomonas sp. NFACC54]